MYIKSMQYAAYIVVFTEKEENRHVKYKSIKISLKKFDSVNRL